MVLHNQLRFYISGDAYYLVGEGGSQPETLTINRKANEVSLSSGPLPQNVSYDKVLPVAGLFGIISLLSSDYLILIKTSRRVSSILYTDIHEATDFALYPIDPAPHGSPALISDKSVEEKYLLGLVKQHLYSAPFYFTYGNYDLTSRLQAQAAEGDDEKQKAMWERADDRFFWNKYLQSRLIELTTRNIHNLGNFILPVMFGFCEIRYGNINGHNFIFGLISRRSRYRAGTRYFSRGIDQKGNVSNFNETEMITLLDHPNKATAGAPVSAGVEGQVRCSFVQIRGSVPLYWAEINNLRYKPDLKVMDLSDTTESLRRHFEHLNSVYGDVYAVNLVNQKGYEKPVKDAFERSVAILANPKVHYTYFDFHHECKGLRFDRVSVLLDSLDDEIDQQGFFYHDSTSGSKPQRKQSSVVRTNCMDCLDRTNVVQSALANAVLNQQLRQVGILSGDQKIDDYPDFIYTFRNVWADNANVISNAYSGSGALKTDYTRTGIRTKEGALQDGYNSIQRYVKNNFFDGPRQDAYDLVTGAWVPRKGGDSFLADRRPVLTRVAPWLLLGLAFVLFFGFWAPATSSAIFGSASKTRLFILVSGAAIFYYITAHGIDYVSWPRLNQLSDTINYEGKGFESARKGRGPASHHGRALSKSTAVREKSTTATYLGHQDNAFRRESVVQGVGQTLPGGHKLTPAVQQEQFKRVPDADATKERVD